MKNWPTIIAAIGAVIPPLLVSLGWLTTEQAGALGVLIAPIWTRIVHGMKPPGGPPAAPTLVALALLCAGCSGTLGEARHAGRVGLPPDSPRCQALDDRHATWTSVAKGAAVVAGGAGLGTMADDDPRIRTGLAIGAAAGAVTAAVAVAVADGAAASWARECQ